MLSRAQNTFHHNPRLRGPVSSVLRKGQRMFVTDRQDREGIFQRISSDKAGYFPKRDVRFVLLK